MAKIIGSVENNLPGDGKIRVVLDVEGIKPENETRATALFTGMSAILADGKVDFFEVLTLAATVGQLGRL